MGRKRNSNSQTSWMTRTATGGPFSFYYRVSSQSGSDWFNFYIDGSRVAHRSGTVNWTQYSTTLVSGTHTLKWEYVKDAGGSSGSDTVWIDDVTVSGDITSWSNIIDLTGVGATSTPWTPVTPGDMYKVRVRAYVDGGYGPWDESNSLFTVTESGGCAPTDLDGDIDLDGHTDGRDVQAFCSAILGVPTAGQICHGDFNGNSQLDIGDVAGFVTALLGS